LDKEKLRALLDRARTTRVYPFIVMASATGCRRQLSRKLRGAGVGAVEQV
jgi:hypothetical protein